MANSGAIAEKVFIVVLFTLVNVDLSHGKKKRTLEFLVNYSAPMTLTSLQSSPFVWIYRDI